ncbi:MAG: hypothetical protein Q7O66_09520 [Dehalococcoidia bacterium]|nr:hypothetical protein [Dehalococcoidia bacterium]
MAVYQARDLATDNAEMAGAKPVEDWRCFMCGEFVVPPGIFWVGNDGDERYDSAVVGFHLDCAHKFSQHLLADYLRAVGIKAGG